LKQLTGHDAVMIVVLNQVDRLGDGEADTCRKDLRRLLDADGLDAVELLTTSARRGDGVEELRAVLADVVQRQAAVARRAAADLDSAAAELTRWMAPGDPAADGALPGTDELVAALSAAAGVPIVLDAVEADYRRRAAEEVGWPFTRLIRRLGPDPLRR